MTHCLCHICERLFADLAATLASLRWPGVLCLLVMTPGINSAMAFNLHQADHNTELTLTAEGRALRIPDSAEINVSVVTRAAKSQEAMKANAVRMQRLIETLSRMHIDTKDIRTRGINLSLEYGTEGKKIRGYIVNNTTSITLKPLARVSQVIDDLSAEGIDAIDGPDFKISQTATAYEQARDQALKQARSDAAGYASRLGLHVNRIIRLNEVRLDTMMPTMLMSSAPRMTRENAATPITPGETSLGVNLEITFELSPLKSFTE